MRYETDYDEIEEEIIKHTDNRNGVDMNRLINRNRPTYLIRGLDAILNCMPEDKETQTKITHAMNQKM